MDVTTALKLKGYHLDPFGEILSDIQTHGGPLEGLKGKHVLELGPGRRVDLMRFWRDHIQVARIQGAGKAVVFPWTRHKDFIAAHVTQIRLLDYFKRVRSSSFDLIYSRLVFEQHSIDPWVLLGSSDYWRQFRKTNFQDFGENYPASIPNLQAIFRQAYKSLKPGGLIVSFIGKRHYSALDSGFLKKLKPAAVYEREIGDLSSMVSVVKH